MILPAPIPLNELGEIDEQLKFGDVVDLDKG
jgi:hypothetical protein